MSQEQTGSSRSNEGDGWLTHAQGMRVGIHKRWSFRAWDEDCRCSGLDVKYCIGALQLLYAGSRAKRYSSDVLTVRVMRPVQGAREG